MTDPEISKWKQNGQIYLWSYSAVDRNYPGWHLTADGLAIPSVLRLCELLRSSQYASKWDLVTSVPTKGILAVPNNGTAVATSPRRITLEFERQHDSRWDAVEEADKFTLRMGGFYLRQFEKGLQGISNGQGDYSIGDSARGPCLWFWWLPAA